MKRFLIAVICGLIVIGVTVLVSCGDDDCPTCPEPEPEHEPDYHLVYSYCGSTIDTKYILTYSSKTGEVIDTATYDTSPTGGEPFGNLAFTHDGEYAVYTSSYNLNIGTSETWVTRTATGDTVSYLSGLGAWAAIISEDDKQVLLTSGNVLAVLTLPDLGIVFSDSIINWGGALHPSEKRIFVALERATDSLFIIDYDELPTTISSIPVLDEDGYTLHITGVRWITEDYLFLNSFIPDIVYFLQVYDLDSLTLIDQELMENRVKYRGAALHPDGKRLFLSYNAGFDAPWISGVDIYYINTGDLLPYITPDEIASNYEGIAPTDIQILPGGESFFILDGGTGYWFGPILQIDISSKEVIRVIRPEDGGTRLIRLNPKDWAE